MPDPANPLYRVVYSEYQRSVIRRLGETAAKRGLKAAYLSAIKSMHDHMMTDPLVWGDPQNQLQYLQLTLYHGMHDPMHVFYAVDKLSTTALLQLRSAA